MDKVHNSNEKKCLDDLLNNFEKIIVPDIQRDYVMGSGGGKLKNLLDKMNDSADSNTQFDFSCLITHEEKDAKAVYIYDGQQRITTLIYLSAYFVKDIKDDNEKTMYIEKLKKFEFTGRKNANELLGAILNNEWNEEFREKYVTDFTTHSICNLVDVVCKKEKNKTSTYKNLNIEFLLKEVRFNYVKIDKAKDVEQFFMDLNAGVKLKDYEIFKAKLNDKVNRLKKNSLQEDSKRKKYDDCLSSWPLKLDNYWLRIFEKFIDEDDYGITEEELEVRFVQYCLKMLYIEKNGYEGIDKKEFFEVEEISAEDIYRINCILNYMEQVISYVDNQQSNANIFNYSWDEDLHKEIRGSYWNLCFDDYPLLIIKFIKSLKKNENDSAYIRDVLLWSVLTNKDSDKEYLRLVKKLINGNRQKQYIAWCKSYDKVYFSKYLVYAIPGYYDEIERKINSSNYAIYTIDIEKDNYMHDLLTMNYSAIEIEDTKKIEKSLGDDSSLSYNNEEFKEKLKFEKLKYNIKKNNPSNNNIDCFENDPIFNGLIRNVWDDSNKECIIDYKTFKGKFYNSNMIGKLGQIYKDLAGYFLSTVTMIDIKDIMTEIDWVIWENGRTVEKVKVTWQNLVDFFTCQDWCNENLVKDWIKSTLNKQQKIIYKNNSCDIKTLDKNFESWLKDKKNNFWIAIFYLFFWSIFSYKGWYCDERKEITYSNDSHCIDILPWYNRMTNGENDNWTRKRTSDSIPYIDKKCQDWKEKGY